MRLLLKVNGCTRPLPAPGAFAPEPTRQPALASVPSPILTSSTRFLWEFAPVTVFSAPSSPPPLQRTRSFGH